AEQYVKAAGESAKGFAALVADLARKAAAFNAGEQGSSRRIKRLIVMTEAPSIDAGEITDKGYVNQRLVQSRRANLVQALFAEPLAPGVLQL
ncbi:MAG TPA: acyl-CoA synthetase, partial [Hyphomonas sp.]|nr:acyl-CoA synthetase [Hyphomonas sp.]